MERDVWIRGAMVVSILALATLILATPTLIGRPAAELALLPLLIIGMPKNESYFIVYLSAAVQAYRYEEVRISVSGTNPPSNGTQDENETYGLHMWVPTQVPSNGSFTIHTYLVDQVQNYFEYNVTVRAVGAGEAGDAAGDAGCLRPSGRDCGGPWGAVGQPEERALGEPLRTPAPAGAVDALARTIVVPVGLALRDRGAHLRELLEDELLLVLVVLDLERRLAVADDAVRRRLAVFLLEQEAVRRDLEDVGEQRPTGDSAGLELDRDVMLPVHDDRIGPSREAVLLRHEQLRLLRGRVDVDEVALDRIAVPGRPRGLKRADRAVQEERRADQPDEGERHEPQGEALIHDSGEGYRRGRDDGRGHREAQDDPLRQQLLGLGRERLRAVQEVDRREEPDQCDRPERVRDLDALGREELHPDDRDDRCRDREVEHAGLGFAGLRLVGLNSLQVHGRGLVFLFSFDELRAFFRREPAAQPPAQRAVAELLDVGRGDELRWRHAFAPARGALCLCSLLSISEGRRRTRPRPARTAPRARPGRRASRRRGG